MVPPSVFAAPAGDEVVGRLASEDGMPNALTRVAYDTEQLMSSS